MAGALKFIEELPKGMDSYLSPNIADTAWGPHAARKKLLEMIYGTGAEGKHVSNPLSGGQMQRLALYVPLPRLVLYFSLTNVILQGENVYASS